MSSISAKNFNPESNSSSGESFYDRIGGRECLGRVHKRLYDKLFAHPVLSAFFADKNQKFQEDQQSDFMAAEFGGPKLYRGRLPQGAHQHLFITEELFELRSKFLAQSLDESGVQPELREQWLDVDRGLKSRIVKKTLDECEKRFTTDHIIVAPET